MKTRFTRTALLALVLTTAAGCDSLLDLQPIDELPNDAAITDGDGARAALAGAYDGLQDGYLYGGDLLFFGDLPTENAFHSGTFNSYALADGNELRPDNGSITNMWDGLYVWINRTNVILQEVPGLEDIDAAERDRILGEAHALRALAYHNLVKLWGDVPLRLEPISGVDEAAGATRASVDEVYAQILSDIEAARGLLSGNDRGDAKYVSVGFLDAFEARVLLYREDWQGALDAAEAAEARGYALEPDLTALFAPDTQTPEDIFKVDFTLQEFNYHGYYYMVEEEGGRREVAPTDELEALYPAGDLRSEAWLERTEDGSLYGTKFPTTAGNEEVHVIRFAEVILTKAEALARLGRTGEAVTELNRIRARAGAPQYAAADFAGQQDLLEAIWFERQLEFAFEGDRWPDLVRTDRVAEVLGIEPYKALWPLPQDELEVAPGLTQNPGY